MKKVLKFAGVISFAAGLVAFILMMVTHSVVYVDGSSSAWYSGTAAIFGSGRSYFYGSIFGIGIPTGEMDFSGTLAWNALIAWIFVLVALVIVCAGVILPLLKIKALEKFAGILNLVSICLFIVGGVLMFFTVPAFAGANEWSNSNGWGLGVGWVFAAILSIVAGAFAALPTVADLMSK